MSVQITTAFIEQYKSNVFHLAQQKLSVNLISLKELAKLLR